MTDLKKGDKIVCVRLSTALFPILHLVNERHEAQLGKVLTFTGYSHSDLPGGRWIYFKEVGIDRRPLKEDGVLPACSLALALYDSKD